MTGRAGKAAFDGALPGLLAYAIGGIGIHAIRPTASYRALELGGGAAEVGLVAAAYALLATLGAMPIGRAIDASDPRRYFIAGLAGVGAGAVVSAWSPTFALLAVGQALVGLGWMVAAIGIQTMTANRRNSDRDRGFARLAVAGAAGQLAGPFLAGLLLDLDPASIPELSRATLALIAGGAASGLGVLVAVRWVKPDTGLRSSTDAGREDRVPMTRIVRRPGVPQALVLGIAVLTSIDLTIVYLPVLGEVRGLSPSVVGTLLALRAGAGLLSRLSLSFLLTRASRRTLLLAAVSAAGAGLLCVGLTHHVLAIGAALVIMGFALGMGVPLTVAWLALQTPRSERATALGVRMTGNRLSQLVLPVGFGAIAAVLSAGSIFVILGVILFGVVGFLRNAPFDDPDEDDRGAAKPGR